MAALENVRSETKDEIHIPVHFRKIVNHNIDNIRTGGCGCGHSFDNLKTAHHQQYKTLNVKNRNKSLNIGKHGNFNRVILIINTLSIIYSMKDRIDHCL